MPTDKSQRSCDVLVLGGHPCAYLAAALLCSKPALRVCHAPILDEAHYRRLVLINPAFFALHKSLAPLQRKLSLSPMYGLRFLADDAETSSEYRSKSALGYVAEYEQVQSALMTLAEQNGVELLKAADINIHQPDESGIAVQVGNVHCHSRALVLAGKLSNDQHRLLAMPDSWGENIMHRHTFSLVSIGDNDLGTRPTLPMSLDLRGSLSWGWMLLGVEQAQISVSQPLNGNGSNSSLELVRHWADVLYRHAILKSPLKISSDATSSLDIPLAGALAHEGVANRTLLIGPAGGFYSACSEDIYPNCWSAIHAVDVLRKALKDTHLQDSLNEYRSCWRTTLGDYLRGPQQNLRFLLPLVYRNQVMTTRLSESILLGKSVVR